MEDRFPAQYSVLLTGSPGVGKFEYLVTEVREALRVGERVVFVTLDLHPNEIRARAKALRLDLQPPQGKSFVFVGCSSAPAPPRPTRASRSSSWTATARRPPSVPRPRRARRRSSSRASRTSRGSGWR